jgi:hypothetical protein
MTNRYDRSNKQKPGLSESFRTVLQLINRDCGEGRASASRSTVPRENIVLGGPSNGCAMSMICAITMESRLAGSVDISGWLPFQPQIEAEVTPTFQEPPPLDLHTFGLTWAGREFVRDAVLEWDRPADPPPVRPLMPVFLGHGIAGQKSCPLPRARRPGTR